MISGPRRLSMGAWLTWFALGPTLWLTIARMDLLFEIGWVLFGAFLLSMSICPLVDALL